MNTTQLGSSENYGSLRVPGGLKAIGRQAFQGNNRFTSANHIRKNRSRARRHLQARTEVPGSDKYV